MNLLQLKEALRAGLFFAVSYSTRARLEFEFADREPASIDRLPPGHYLIVQLPMPPTSESGVYAIAEPRRGQAVGGTPTDRPLPPMPGDTDKSGDGRPSQPLAMAPSPEPANAPAEA